MGTYCQSLYRTNISVNDANDLLHSLNKKLNDTVRIDILLKLVQYNLEKESDEKLDLDSASMFLNKAKEINSKQITNNRKGLIFLYESYIEAKNGKIEIARPLINLAIQEFQISKDEFHLSLAYLELTRFYNSNDSKDADTIKGLFNILFQNLPKNLSSLKKDEFIMELITFYSLKMRSDSRVIKLDFLEHLVKACQLLNSKSNEFWVRKEIADNHYQDGKIDVAMKELLQIANEQKEGGYQGICFTYDLLSALYYANASYEKALYYSLETIKNVHSTLDSEYLNNFYTRVAANYGANGDPTEAVVWNQKRLEYLEANKQANQIYALLVNLTSDMIKIGKQREALTLILQKSNTFSPQGNDEKRCMLLSLAQCYSAVNENATAERYAQELIKLTELRIKRKELLSDPWLYRFLMSFYLKLGQNDKAEFFFQETMAGLPDLRKGTVLLFKNNFLFKLDSARGNYLSSIRYLQKWQAIKDSIFTATKSKQIEELKIEYETDQVKLNNQLLSKQDQLQKSKLRQGAVLRNISFAVVGLLIIIVVLLYSRFRLKQKTNKKLEFQQIEIAKRNTSLQHLVNEKDWLVKEIHHRVKNNLQIVMSLLNSQSAYIDNGPALTAIHDSQHRVHAMSLIHQKLYNSENLSSIDMSIYIRELVAYLSDSFDTRQRIRFELAVDPLEMDVSQAVPLGLVLNEAITNSIKYAFPENRNGVISILLKNTAPNRYLLVISDNGIGMPSNFSNKKPGSLGMSLMAGLSEDLDGNFSIENNKGTTIRISFAHNMNIGRSGTIVPSVVSNN
jgi:two-component sensor histidine kinase